MTMVWDKAKDDVLKTLWENGYSDKEIADHFGLPSKYPVHYRRMKLGMVRYGQRGPSPVITNQVREYIMENPELSNKAVADEFDISHSWVCRIRKEMGMANHTYERWLPWQLEILREVYPERGARAVAVKTGLPIKKVWTKASQIGLSREQRERY